MPLHPMLFRSQFLSCCHLVLCTLDTLTLACHLQELQQLCLRQLLLACPSLEQLTVECSRYGIYFDSDMQTLAANILLATRRTQLEHGSAQALRQLDMVTESPVRSHNLWYVRRLAPHRSQGSLTKPTSPLPSKRQHQLLLWCCAAKQCAQPSCRWRGRQVESRLCQMDRAGVCVGVKLRACVEPWWRLHEQVRACTLRNRRLANTTHNCASARDCVPTG